MSYSKDTSFSQSEKSPYPSQQMGPPPMGNPYQSQQMGPPPMGNYAPPSYPYAPPPYSNVPNPMPVPQAQHYSYSTATMTNPGPPPPYSFQQQSYSVGYPTQAGYTYHHSQNITATAQFDSGARFDGIATQHIPPPPPGCAPNAAQMAVAQGGTVLATQKKGSWLTGGSGGGVSFW